MIAPVRRPTCALCGWRDANTVRDTECVRWRNGEVVEREVFACFVCLSQVDDPETPYVPVQEFENERLSVASRAYLALKTFPGRTAAEICELIGVSDLAGKEAEAVRTALRRWCSQGRLLATGERFKGQRYYPTKKPGPAMVLARTQHPTPLRRKCITCGRRFTVRKPSYPAKCCSQKCGLANYWGPRRAVRR